MTTADHCASCGQKHAKFGAHDCVTCGLPPCAEASLRAEIAELHRDIDRVKEIVAGYGNLIAQMTDILRKMAG